MQFLNQKQRDNLSGQHRDTLNAPLNALPVPHRTVCQLSAVIISEESGMMPRSQGCAQNTSENQNTLCH